MYDKCENLILVANKSELSFASYLCGKLVHAGEKVLILAEDNIDIHDKNYPARNFKYYKKFYKIRYTDIKRKVNELFYSLAEKKVSGDLTLKELTKYKGVSLWDLSIQYIFSELLPILYNYNVAEILLNLENPSRVHILKDATILEKIFISICRKKEIHFQVYKPGNSFLLHIGKVISRLMMFTRKIKRFLASIYFLLSNIAKYKRRSKKYKVVFFSSVARFLDSVLPVIIKYGEKERLVVSDFLSSSSKMLKENNIVYIGFYGIELYGVSNWRAQGLLKKIRKVINNKVSFYENISYKEIPIGFLLNGMFEKIIYEIFPNSIRNINTVRKIILRYKPEAVVLATYSPDIILTAKSLSIPVMSIQSGFVEELFYFGPVIADAVMVDGNYWKTYILQRQSIDSDKVHVTGPVRFDLASRNGLNNEDARTILSVNKLKKIVLATTHLYFNNMGIINYEREEQISGIFRAIKNIKGAQVIIKLHPCEKDIAFYEKMVKEAGLQNYIIVKDADILKLLCDCDLLIAHTSTVCYDAILLDKDVICLFGSSIFEPDDLWDFRKYDAAMILDNLDDLEKCIRKALFDPETIARLKEGRKQYVSEHAYKLDGKASNRVKEVIDQFLLK